MKAAGQDMKPAIPIFLRHKLRAHDNPSRLRRLTRPGHRRRPSRRIQPIIGLHGAATKTS